MGSGVIDGISVRAPHDSGTRKGLARAAQGKRLGGPSVSAGIVSKVKSRRHKGQGILSIAKELGIGTGTVQRIVNSDRPCGYMSRLNACAGPAQHRLADQSLGELAAADRLNVAQQAGQPVEQRARGHGRIPLIQPRKTARERLQYVDILKL